ncbi:hypothetical protein PoB_002564800 [Plakobranchus ocellatus]|uniref:Uncharacterized protein n=1 Tax=Plakobranchus ocellatus TaxID=259542 RepID=A0AAV3ZXK2_9GAST|nr:hypothetical protein PoB_002564800 [Plakobranchus ocellatus]
MSSRGLAASRIGWHKSGVGIAPSSGGEMAACRAARVIPLSGGAVSEMEAESLSYHPCARSSRASVVQWLVSPPRDLQGPFCSGFEYHHRCPGLTEDLKA